MYFLHLKWQAEFAPSGNPIGIEKCKNKSLFHHYYKYNTFDSVLDVKNVKGMSNNAWIVFMFTFYHRYRLFS